MEKRTILAFLGSSFLVLAIPIITLAQPTGPTADNLGVGDTTGNSGTYVEVPVNITNVANGPIQGIRLRIDYNERVLNLTNVIRGDLTLNWTALYLGVDRHTVTIGTGYLGDAIQIGSSGSVVRLNFNVTGARGARSPVKLTLIELSNPDGIVGTAPAKNGTFNVTSTTSTSTTTYSGGGGGGGYYVPPTTPTPKGTGVERAEEIVAPPSPSPSLTPNSTPAPSIQTATSALATVPQTPPLFLLLIVIGVIVVTSIIIMVLRR